MILSIKMHPACGQDHNSRVHFLLCSQADIKSPTSRDFLQKLSVVQTTAGFLFFWESVKKLEEAFLMKACSPLRSEHKQRNL